MRAAHSRKRSRAMPTSRGRSHQTISNTYSIPRGSCRTSIEFLNGFLYERGSAIMKATVIVTLKPTVLDPQGMTIQRSVASLGLTDITDVRQGKIFHVQLQDGKRDQLEKLAKEVLTNPVIEEYRIIWE